MREFATFCFVASFAVSLALLFMTFLMMFAAI